MTNALTPADRLHRDLVADFACMSSKPPSFSRMLKLALRERAYAPTITLRHCQRWRGAKGIGRVVHEFWLGVHAVACARAGMVLPATLEVGPGLHIVHGLGLHVAEDTRIGAGVTLYNGVNVMDDRFGRGSDDRASIGDKVVIGPNAVVSAVKIGSGARIAALANVTADVADGGLALATPAKTRQSQAETS